LTGVKVLDTVGTIDVLGVDMFSEIISELVQDFRSQLSHTFTGGKGLSVNRITPEETVRLQALAQEAKAAVGPTVAGFEAKADLVKAESAMSVAGIKYLGAGAEAFTQQVEAVADLSDVIVESSPRVQAALARLNQNIQILGAESERIMFGEEDARPQAIAQLPQQRMLFASR